MENFKKGDTIHIYSTVIKNMSMKGFLVGYKNERITETFYTRNIEFTLIYKDRIEHSGLIKNEYMHLTKFHTSRMVLTEKILRIKNGKNNYGRVYAWRYH